MDTVYVFLAEGFEEIEAFTPVDLLRRAGIAVKTVSFADGHVQGGHGIVVQADIADAAFALPEDAVMLVLPGGSPGAENLAASTVVKEALLEADKRNIVIAAICAAPSVLHPIGLLKGKRVTAFPTVQKSLTGSNVTGKAVEVDGNLITARSAGVALAFAHALIVTLAGTAKADAVVANIYPGE